MFWNRKLTTPAIASGSKVAGAWTRAVGESLDDRKGAPAVAGNARGRLIFGMDATASRQATWDQACGIQGSMFNAAAGAGGLDVKLVFYRGADECKASRWSDNAKQMHGLMGAVHCVGGSTQIHRILAHTLAETRRQNVNALIFVGDAMEEDGDRLCRLAAELGALGVPIFIFQEGLDAMVASTFKQMAKLSHGAYSTFDLAGVDRLKELLGAVAVYAAGGYSALVEHGKRNGAAAVLQLTSQLPGK